MTKPDELVEEIAKMLLAYDTGIVNGWSVADGWEKELFKRRATEIVNKLLSEIQKGDVVESDGNDYFQLKPEYQRFIEDVK